MDNNQSTAYDNMSFADMLKELTQEERLQLAREGRAAKGEFDYQASARKMLEARRPRTLSQEDEERIAANDNWPDAAAQERQRLEGVNRMETAKAVGQATAGQVGEAEKVLADAEHIHQVDPSFPFWRTPGATPSLEDIDAYNREAATRKKRHYASRGGTMAPVLARGGSPAGTMDAKALAVIHNIEDYDPDYVESVKDEFSSFYDNIIASDDFRNQDKAVQQKIMQYRADMMQALVDAQKGVAITPEKLSLLEEASHAYNRFMLGTVRGGAGIAKWVFDSMQLPEAPEDGKRRPVTDTLAAASSKLGAVAKGAADASMKDPSAVESRAAQADSWNLNKAVSLGVSGTLSSMSALVGNSVMGSSGLFATIGVPSFGNAYVEADEALKNKYPTLSAAKRFAMASAEAGWNAAVEVGSEELSDLLGLGVVGGIGMKRPASAFIGDVAKRGTKKFFAGVARNMKNMAIGTFAEWLEEAVADPLEDIAKVYRGESEIAEALKGKNKAANLAGYFMSSWRDALLGVASIPLMGAGSAGLQAMQKRNNVTNALADPEFLKEFGVKSDYVAEHLTNALRRAVLGDRKGAEGVMQTLEGMGRDDLHNTDITKEDVATARKIFDQVANTSALGSYELLESVSANPLPYNGHARVDVSPLGTGGLQLVTASLDDEVIGMAVTPSREDALMLKELARTHWLGVESPNVKALDDARYAAKVDGKWMTFDQYGHKMSEMSKEMSTRLEAEVARQYNKLPREYRLEDTDGNIGVHIGGPVMMNGRQISVNEWGRTEDNRPQWMIRGSMDDLDWVRNNAEGLEFVQGDNENVLLVAGVNPWPSLLGAAARESNILLGGHAFSMEASNSLGEAGRTWRVFASPEDLLWLSKQDMRLKWDGESTSAILYNVDGPAAVRKAIDPNGEMQEEKLETTKSEPEAEWAATLPGHNPKPLVGYLKTLPDDERNTALKFFGDGKTIAFYPGEDGEIKAGNRQQCVEESVANGVALRDNGKNSYSFVYRNGVTIPVNKAAYDYALYLRGKYPWTKPQQKKTEKPSEQKTDEKNTQAGQQPVQTSSSEQPKAKPNPSITAADVVGSELDDLQKEKQELESKAAEGKATDDDRTRLAEVNEELEELQDVTNAIPSDETKDTISGKGEVQRLKVADIKVDPKRFQFKSNTEADTGVERSNELTGDWDDKTAGNIYVWQDTKGDYYVVNGHHRLDLARRKGVKEINAMVEREADGVTEEEAKKNGVLINIRDGQGTVEDYARFIHGHKMTEGQARSAGFIRGRNGGKGWQGYLIGSVASEAIYSAFLNGDISAEKAAAIVEVTRGDEGLEAAGIRMSANMDAASLKEAVKALRQAPKSKPVQGDLFGFDDSAIRTAEAIGKLVAKRKAALTREIRAAKPAVKRPDLAEGMDVAVGDNAEEMLKQKQAELERLDHYDTDHELYQELLAEVTKEPEKKPKSEKPVEKPAAKPVAEKPAEQPKPAEQQKPTEKPAAEKPAEQPKPAEQQKPAVKPVAEKPVEQPKPAAKPAEPDKLTQAEIDTIPGTAEDKKKVVEYLNSLPAAERANAMKWLVVQARKSGNPRYKWIEWLIDNGYKPMPERSALAKDRDVRTVNKELYDYGKWLDEKTTPPKKETPDEEKKQDETPALSEQAKEYLDSLPEDRRLNAEMALTYTKYGSASYKDAEEMIAKGYKPVIKDARNGLTYFAKGDTSFAYPAESVLYGEWLYNRMKKTDQTEAENPQPESEQAAEPTGEPATEAPIVSNNKIFDKPWLTEDEIRNSGVGDENMILLAIDYINGATNNSVCQAAYAQVKLFVDGQKKENGQEFNPKTDAELRSIIESDGNSVSKRKALQQYAEKNNITEKAAQERVEEVLVFMASEIEARNITPREKFDLLLKLYQNQPTLDVRTSTSVANQAYSTPAPLAFALGNRIDLASGKSIYEPAGGNGMLVAGAPHGNVHINELDTARVAALNRQGDFAEVTNKDALQYVPGGTYDREMMNPPFDNLSTPIFTEDGYKLTKLDHAISYNALTALSKDGKAGIIIGANTKNMGGKGNATNADWVFMNWLYRNFNVKDNFIIDGRLYEHQGAGYPLRVITLDGRRETPAGEEDAPREVEKVNTWEEVWDRLNAPAPAPAPTKTTEQTEQAKPEQTTPQLSKPESNNQPAKEAVNKPAPKAEENTAAQSDLDSDIDNVMSDIMGNLEEFSNATKGKAQMNFFGFNDGQIAAITKLLYNGTRLGFLYIQKGLTKFAEWLDAMDKKLRKLFREHGLSDDNIDEFYQDVWNSQYLHNGQRHTLAMWASELGQTHEIEAGEQAGELNVRYNPASNARPLETVAPKYLADAMAATLNRLQERVGNLDQFVMKELGYSSLDELYDKLAGEQVDGVAMIIDAMNRGDGFILGDQTGIGKGRQCAAVMRWAIRHDRIPVFVTEKSNLFTDMYRDGVDVGIEFNPVIYSGSSEGNILDRNKEVVHYAMSAKQRKEGIQGLLKGEKEHNCVFMTYSQINKPNTQRSELLDLVNNRKCVLVLDEAHNAAGDSQTGDFFIDLLKVDMPVLYASATFAKRPDNMRLYYRTSLRKAVDDIEVLPIAIRLGGVPLQQVVSRQLAEDGLFIRRERDFRGVEFENVCEEPSNYKEVLTNHDRTVRVLEKMVAFSELIRAILKKQNDDTNAGTREKSAIESASFASVCHNYINQMLLASKVDLVVERAIMAHKAGEKPVIALTSTIESAISYYMQDKGIKSGDRADMRYADILLAALERMKKATKKSGKGIKTVMELDFQKMGIMAQYIALRNAIESLRDMEYPVSPIDYLRNKLSAAGIKTGEITGRTGGIDYSGENPLFYSRDAEDKGKNKNINDFNDGVLDCLIINQSGATGMSIHASSKFRDQRVRRMIMAQPSLDVNVVMQMFGRIMRSGQVVLPKYEILSTPLAAERRPHMILPKKMKSLNANTTANSKGMVELGVDYMNEIGDAVANEMLLENPTLGTRIGLKGQSIQKDDNGNEFGGDAELAKKMCGKMAILPNADQERLYKEIEKRYIERVELLKASGEYKLETEDYDWQAEENPNMPPETIVEGTEGGSMFEMPVVLHHLLAREKRRIPSWQSVQNRIKENKGDADKIEKAREALNGIAETYSRLHEAGVEGMGPDEAVEEKITSAGVLNEVEQFLYDHPADSVYKMKFGEMEYNAYLTGLKIDKISDIKLYRASRIVLEYAIDSNAARIRIPFSQFQNGKCTLERLLDWPQDIFTGDERVFRIAKTVITGNLVKGYECAQKGRIVNYTNANGGHEIGIMMPKNWNADELARDPRRELEGPDAVMKELEKAGPDRLSLDVASSDGVMNLNAYAQISNYTPRIEYGGVAVRIVVSSRFGKRYITDAGLVDIVGEFTGYRHNKTFSTRSFDLAKPNERKIVENAVKYLMEQKGVQFRKELPNSQADAQYLTSQAVENPMPASEARKTVSDLRKEYAVPVRLVQSEDELPEDLRQQIDIDRQRGVFDGGRTWKGVYWGDRVYVNAEAAESAEDIALTVMHEAGGHGGLRLLFPDAAAFNAFLDKAGEDYGAVRMLAEKYEQRGLSHRRAIEEGIMELGDRYNSSPIWKKIMLRVYDIIRNMLSKIGVKVSDMTAIRNVIRNAASAAKNHSMETIEGMEGIESAMYGVNLNAPANITDVEIPDVDLKDIAAIRNYLKAKYQGMKARIQADGRITHYTKRGLKDSLKRRGEVRQTFGSFDAVIKNSYPVGYELADEAHKEKRQDLQGQYIYASVIRLPNGVEYLATIKFDDSEKDVYAQFKDISIKEMRPLYAGNNLPVGRTSSVRASENAQSVYTIDDVVKIAREYFKDRALFRPTYMDTPLYRTSEETEDYESVIDVETDGRIHRTARRADGTVIDVEMDNKKRRIIAATKELFKKYMFLGKRRGGVDASINEAMFRATSEIAAQNEGHRRLLVKLIDSAKLFYKESWAQSVSEAVDRLWNGEFNADALRDNIPHYDDPRVLSHVETVLELRASIDRLSGQVENIAKISEYVRQAIENNMGSYHFRAYRIHRDKSYKPSDAVRLKALTAVAGELIDAVKASEESMNSIIGHYDTEPILQNALCMYLRTGDDAILDGKDKRFKTRARILRRMLDRTMKSLNNGLEVLTSGGYVSLQADPKKVNARADSIIQRLIDKHGDMSNMSAGSATWKIIQTSFIRRKDLPQWIRELFGEITDIGTQAEMTTRRLTAIVVTDKMYRKLKEYNDGLSMDDNHRSFYPSEYKRDGIYFNKRLEGPKFGALEGMYTDKNTYDLLTGFERQESGWGAAYRSLVALNRYLHTVGNPPTHLRNFIGNVSFAANDGELWRPGYTKHMYKAFKTLLTQSDEASAERERLMRLGLIGSSAHGVEMFQIATRLAPILNLLKLNHNDFELKELLSPKGRVLRMLEHAAKKVESAYALEDNLFRVAAFYAKEARGETAKEAVERIRDLYPTYDMAPVLASFLSRNLPIGKDFMIFHFEAMRCYINSFKYMVKDLKTGDCLSTIGMIGNMALAMPAVQILSGLVFGMMHKAFWGLLGKDDDDEIEKAGQEEFKAFRVLLPEYLKDHAILPWKAGKRIAYMDMGYIYPFDFLPALVELANSNESFTVRASDMAKDAVFETLFGGMTAKLIAEQIAGYEGRTGKKLEGFGIRIKHLSSGLTPSSWHYAAGSIRLMAAEEDQLITAEGERKTAGSELAKTVIPIRVYKKDIPTSYLYKMRVQATEVRAQKAKANLAWRRAASHEGTKADAEATQKEVQARLDGDIMEQIHLLDEAGAKFLTRQERGKLLREAGFSMQDTMRILDNKPIRYVKGK